MKISYIKKNFQLTINLLVVLLLLFLLIANPTSARANDANETKPRTQELDPRGAKEINSVVKYKRFQVELYGGFTTLSPSDFNLFVDYDNRIQEFNYESFFDYLRSNNQIRSWTKNQDGDRKKIRNAFPLGVRLKFYLKNSIAVSVGFKYFSRERESNLEFQYTRNELSGDQNIESLTYSPYSLSTNAYIPLLGIHFTKKIKGALNLEGYLSGGPMFVECHYLSQWSYEWRVKEPNNEYVVFTDAGILEEKGTGTGVALDLGGRLNYPLVKRMEIFLEGGYAYQVAKNISGPGSEFRRVSSETWNGQWGIKREKIVSPWGELEVDLPTSYWPDNPNEGKVRDFELDLSGFQVRLGMSFRF